jgi:hypothetical protein
MQNAPDLAQIRFHNAMALFDEFVHSTVKHPDAATLRGLEGRFAQKLLLQPSYWSQIKGRSRQIGERLARQFEQLCHKPHGWMDQAHSASSVASHATSAASGSMSSTPQDDDERFIVGLVLTYYRRHPQRARTRLLDLLGEVLTPATEPRSEPRPESPPPATVLARDAAKPNAKAATPVDEAHALWMRSQAHVAPLKRKK